MLTCLKLIQFQHQSELKTLFQSSFMLLGKVEFLFDLDKGLNYLWNFKGRRSSVYIPLKYYQFLDASKKLLNTVENKTKFLSFVRVAVF